MIRKITLSSLLMSLSYCFVYAQENAELKFKRELGFNTSFILQGIFNSNETPFSFLYKTYKRQQRATRYGLDITFNFDDNDPGNSGSYYSNTSSANIALTLGKEIQMPISSSRWIWFFGGDMIPFYQFNNADYYQNTEKYQVYESSSYGLSARPFVGIRFDINERLYLSAEASVRLTYGHQNIFNKLTNQAEPVRDTEGDNFHFALQPATGIFIFYRF
ncbi:MAG TPA: hypothetical protein VFW11_06845 [Cyclobacteriaceae bacterium]|nr:hypothetical protein [Cyclobacteriaceae bacterium]